MSVRTMGYLFGCLSAIPVILYFLGMPVEYPRIGLLAGLGIGVVFGSTVPVESEISARLARAVRTSVAFAATTGVGYGFYQGQNSGIAWAIGGTLGCICGVLTAQVARDLFGNDELPDQ